jgi:hypothetical protein
LNWEVLCGEAALIVDEVLEPDRKPPTVLELELLAVVDIPPMALVVGTDVSTAGTETGWPTPEHKDSTTLDTAIGPSYIRSYERGCGFSYLVGPRYHRLY